MFLHLSVSHFVHRGEGGVWETPPGRHPPPGQTSPSWADTPLGRQPPGQTPPPPSRRLLQWTIRVLLECILVTHVCHSAHSGRGGLCIMSVPVWLPGRMFLLRGGGLCPGWGWWWDPLSKALGVFVRDGGLCEGGGFSVKGDRY